MDYKRKSRVREYALTIFMAAIAVIGLAGSIRVAQWPHATVQFWTLVAASVLWATMAAIHGRNTFLTRRRTRQELDDFRATAMEAAGRALRKTRAENIRIRPSGDQPEPIMIKSVPVDFPANIHAKSVEDLVLGDWEPVSQESFQATFEGATADRGDDYAGDIPESSIPSALVMGPESLAWERVRSCEWDLSADAVLRSHGISRLPDGSFERVMSDGGRVRMEGAEVAGIIKIHRSQQRSRDMADALVLSFSAAKPKITTSAQAEAAVQEARTKTRNEWMNERIDRINRGDPAGRALFEGIVGSGLGITPAQVEEMTYPIVRERLALNQLTNDLGEGTQEEDLHSNQMQERRLQLAKRLDETGQRAAATVAMLGAHLKNALEENERLRVRVVGQIANQSAVNNFIGLSMGSEVRDIVECMHDELMQQSDPAKNPLHALVLSLRDLMDPVAGEGPAGPVQ